MKSFKELPSVKEQLMKCVRCGQCRSVCPVFAEVRNETASPRGHVFMVQMLRDDKVELSANIYDKFSQCLMCETCSVNCPSGIDIHELNAAARSYLCGKYPSKTKDIVFEKIWSNPRLLKGTTSLMWASQKSGLQKIARHFGLTKFLPGDLVEAEKILSDVPRFSARQNLPEFNKSRTEKKYTVGYFLGCGTDLLNPKIARATVDVLTHNGCDVIIPQDMNCCGLPHIANGKASKARELAIHNINVFKKHNFDYIVTDCASCSAALSKKNLEFVLHGHDDEKMSADINSFTDKVIDLNVFLIDILDIKIPENSKTKNMRVTYHDPCHLANAQGIKKQPRELLKRIPGVELVEMKDANRCCGGSGTYSITHYQLSMKILDKKMNNIKNTGADIVGTCCPSCIIQLKHGAKRNKLAAQILHPIEIISKIYNS